MTKVPKTRSAAVREYNAILRQCRRDLRGGLTYGLDWPTLRATFPERYKRLCLLSELYNIPRY